MSIVAVLSLLMSSVSHLVSVGVFTSIRLAVTMVFLEEMRSLLALTAREHMLSPSLRILKQCRDLDGNGRKTRTHNVLNDHVFTPTLVADPARMCAMAG
jgi:hypothetical protein